MNTGYRKRVIVLLFVLLLGRFWFSQTFELTGPEAYAWEKGRQLDWGYLDQGPLVPLASWIGTLFYRQSELGVRFVAANSFVFVGFILFFLGRSWFNPRVGFYSVLLYVVLPIFAWQMLLLSEATLGVALMVLALYCFKKTLERHAWFWWIAAGVTVATATMLDWWNALWAMGFLAFYCLDPHRTGRLMVPKSATFLGISLVGLVPHLAWHFLTFGWGSHGTSSWALFGPHQAAPGVDNLGASFFAALIWVGPLGLMAVVILVWARRSRLNFLREHLFFVTLPLPGLLMQLGLTFFRCPDYDVMAALLLPLIFVSASLAVRLMESQPRWKTILLSTYLLTALQTLSGFWPDLAIQVWKGFAPRPYHWMENVSDEVVRWQRETGASFLVADSPYEASLLSFYLPLRPFVHVVAREGVHSQYDLWTSYYDLKGGTALFLIQHDDRLPSQITREFARVTKLPEVKIPGQDPWRLFLCTNFGATSEASP